MSVIVLFVDVFSLVVALPPPSLCGESGAVFSDYHACILATHAVGWGERRGRGVDHQS